MAEHLICNQAVDGSTPFTSSIHGGFPERPKGADCKSVVTDFGGPNPPSPTRKNHLLTHVVFSMKSAVGGKNPPTAEEIHLRRMKSLRDEIPLRGDVWGGFHLRRYAEDFIVRSTISWKNPSLAALSFSNQTAIFLLRRTRKSPNGPFTSHAVCGIINP